MKKFSKKMLRKQKTLYDFLYKNDPLSANLVLIVFELERFYAKKGVKPLFGNFKAGGTQLDEFMTRNKEKLLYLMGERFPDPEAYSFGDFNQKIINEFYKYQGVR